MNKKSISLLTLLFVFFSCTVSFCEEAASAEFVCDVEGRPMLDSVIGNDNYTKVHFCIKDVTYDAKTNTVTFTHLYAKQEQFISVPQDKNYTYVVDNKTALHIYSDGRYSGVVESIMEKKMPEGVSGVILPSNCVTVYIEKGIAAKIANGTLKDGTLVHIAAFIHATFMGEERISGKRQLEYPVDRDAFTEPVTLPEFICDVEGRPELTDFMNNDNYSFLYFRATDVSFDAETNTVTFKNAQKRASDYLDDTNIYVIDNNTALSKYDDDTYTNDVFRLIDGTREEVIIILPVDVRNQILDGMNDTLVHVDALWGSFVTKNNGKVTDELLQSLLSESTVASDGYGRVLEYGIMKGDENGNLKLEKYVTRAEMAQFVVNALGLDGIEAYVAPGNEFTDVLKEHWAYNAIMMAKGLEFVNGYGDGTFLPGNFVTYDEAVKMVMEILGYKPEAEKRGAYPNGYGEIAKLIGIIGEYNGNEYITRGEIAVMLEKALDVPMMVQVVYGSNPEYKIMTGSSDGVGAKTLKSEHEN